MATLTHKARTVTVTAALLLSLLQGTGFGLENWRQSFEETCSKTEQAMNLSVDELDALLERCGALEKAIQTEEESVRKVYLKRLQMCRNLYSYVLDFKKNAQSPR